MENKPKEIEQKKLTFGGRTIAYDEFKKSMDVLKNLANLTGRDLIAAEQQARAEGDLTPMINLSLRYQAALAAKAMGVKLDDVMDLPANRFTYITNAVASFLLK